MLFVHKKRNTKTNTNELKALNDLKTQLDIIIDRNINNKRLNNEPEKLAYLDGKIDAYNNIKVTIEQIIFLFT